MNSPDTPIKQMLLDASRALQSGQSQQALNICSAILQKRPKTPEAFFIAGQVLMEAKRLKQAVEAFQNATSLSPKYAGAWACLALVYQRAVAPSRAEKMLAKAIKYQSSDQSDVQHTIAIVLTGAGREKEAEKWYSRASQSAPENLEYKMNHATNLTYLGDQDRAKVILEDVLQQNAVSPRAHWSLSGLVKATDQTHIDTMQAILEKLQESDLRERSYLNYAMGKEFEDLGDWQSAFNAFSLGAAAQRQQIEYDEAGNIETFAALEKLFTRQWLDNQQGYQDASPIFVVGQPRTGTTLIERIMTAHSAIESIGERQYFLSAAHYMLNNKKVATFSPTFLSDISNLDMRVLGQRYIARCARERGNARYFINKAPNNFMLIPMILAALPNAKIIHVVRDPRDVCVSVFKQLFGKDAYPYSYELGEMARHYVRYHQLMNCWRERFQGQFYELAYEDITRDFESCANNLFDHLGIPWEHQVLEFHTQQSSVATASAVQVRSPIHTQSLERWQHYAAEIVPVLNILKQGGII